MTDNIVPRVALVRMVRACQALARAQGGPLAREADDALAELTAVSRPAPPPRAAYSITEVATLLGRSERTVYRWARAGLLDASKVGGSWTVPAATVAALANRGHDRTSQDTGRDSRADVTDDTDEPTEDVA